MLNLEDADRRGEASGVFCAVAGYHNMDWRVKGGACAGGFPAQLLPTAYCPLGEARATPHEELVDRRSSTRPAPTAEDHYQDRIAQPVSATKIVHS